MRALIAGTGDLPVVLGKHDPDMVVCAMDGFEPSLPVDLRFRIETLGQLLDELQQRGVKDVCFAGAIHRPQVDPSAIDAKTLPLVPRLIAAINKGDDGALRDVIAIFQEHGFRIVAAHDIAPFLIPPAGVLSVSDRQAMIAQDAQLGETTIAEMGHRDQGQACIVRAGDVIAQEQRNGTDAMLQLPALENGILFKAPKPDQDRRVDLPTIGIGTVHAAHSAGLLAIVIEHGGVMMLDQDAVIAAVNEVGMCLWVRPKGAG